MGRESVLVEIGPDSLTDITLGPADLALSEGVPELTPAAKETDELAQLM